MKDKILKIFSSSIKIKVTGRNINNFLKRLINNNINIEKVIPISHKEIDLIINYQDLDKVLKLKTIYNIKIVRYYGKLRIIKRIKKDIFILSSLLISLLLIYTLSNVIFKVEVIHSNKNIIKLVTKELEDNGIKKYKFVKNYQEIEKIKNKILEENKDTLEWLEIIREGTKYTIRVEERIINNKPKDNKIYNIVASKNAVIKNIYAESGEKIRSINTYVKKGDIIISSDITLPNNEKISKTASGKVQGEVWYNINIEYPYQYHEMKYTGNKKKVLQYFMDDCKEKKIPFVLHGVTHEMEEEFREIFGDIYEIEYDRDISEYIYDREKLATLSGKKLHGKRNHINRFKENHEWSYEPLSDENQLEVLAMLMEWKMQNCDPEDIEKHDEICVSKNCVINYKELGLVGGVLRAEGKIVGFSIGERASNEDTFIVHIEKAFADIQGAYPMINQQFVIHEMEDFKYVNREDDAGEEGLRKSKLSYRPVFMVDKGVLRLKSEVKN